MNIFFSCLSGNELTAYKHFCRVLERLGHRVFFFSTPSRENDLGNGKWIEAGFSHEVTFDGLLEAAGFKPDLFLYMEPDGIIPRGIEKAAFPTACIISDTHRWLEARQRLAHFFDHVFLFHRNYVPKFTDHPDGHIHWMPYACDLEFFHPTGAEKDLDLAFIGNLDFSPERQRLMKRFVKLYHVNEQKFFYQREIPEIYSRAKIVLNFPLGDDLNYRTFEALSCGSLLLTRRMNNGQEQLFKEGVHYEAYGDEQELEQKIAYYLSHPNEREKIAQAGLVEIRQNHSLDQRLSTMLDVISAHPSLAAPVRKLTRDQVYREYAWLYEYWREPGAGLRLVRDARNERLSYLLLLLPALRSILRVLFR